MSKKRSHKDVGEAIAAKFGLPKGKGGEIGQAITDVIIGMLKKDEQVEFRGLGKFSVVTRKARTGINPKTREVIQIPEKRTVAFKKSSKTEY